MKLVFIAVCALYCLVRSSEGASDNVSVVTDA